MPIKYPREFSKQIIGYTVLSYELTSWVLKIAPQTETETVGKD